MQGWSKLKHAAAAWFEGFGLVSHTEKLLSAAGGLIGILVILVVSFLMFDPTVATTWIVASMGASAVLLFAVPHGALSQPWALVGGHGVSAVIGVACYQWVPDPTLAAALAVGLAIGAMYYLRCIHPPGGATALSAVVGGSEVHALGYGFVLTPVMINVAVILVVAVLVNYPFAWRRYPAFLARAPKRATPAPVVEAGDAAGVEDSVEAMPSQADLDYALRQIDSFIDITGDDLARIYALAMQHSHERDVPPGDVGLGRCYSNGRYGDQWSVRQIVDESGSRGAGDELVIYKILAGTGRRQPGTCTRAEFANWARYEVSRNENSWQRVRQPGEGGDPTPAQAT
ncbi:MAG TPA: HPP family protein [Acidiferrobacterales bacterium]